MKQLCPQVNIKKNESVTLNLFQGLKRCRNKFGMTAWKYSQVKKNVCITILLVVLVLWCNITFAAGEWRRGVITEITETTITVNGTTYEIDSNTVIKDEQGSNLPVGVLGQKTCCNNVRILVRGNEYIEKIIVDTSKAVR
jgi:hypothetical protein